MAEDKKSKKHHEVKEEKEAIAAPGEEVKTEEKAKTEVKKEVKKVDRPKKTEAVIRVTNIPLSTKTAAEICKFIKGKTISHAVRDLEQVTLLKKPVPMKGEYPHRKGKRISSGKYPIRASKNFIILLKSLASNASDINEPVIVKAIANIGARPYGRFGSIRRKRTHLEIVARERKVKEAKK